MDRSFGGLDMHSYILYGSTICSDLSFPQLIEASDGEHGHMDITIQEGTIPEDIKIQEKDRKYRFDKRRSWLINTTAWLLVEDGNKVTYELRANANLNYLRTYILGYAMSMLYLQRGEMAIHCAAVSKDGEAVLIAGESGSGKSTVTNALLEAGYQLMADDLAIVRFNKQGEPMVAPGFPYQKLCSDVVVKRGYCLDHLIYINEEKDKYLVPYEGEFCTHEKPLKAMVLLTGVDTVDQLSIKPLKGMDKFHVCVNNLFLKRLLKEQRYESNIGKTCLEIASKVPFYDICRPLGANTLHEIKEYIVSCVS